VAPDKNSKIKDLNNDQGQQAL